MPLWLELVDRSFLTDDLKNMYKELFQSGVSVMRKV